MKSEILVVDDERALREGMKGLLSGEGYAVRTARDGEDALAKIDGKRPDLVLLDVMMSKMNGFRCCEEIRRTDPLLPVIFLTAKDSEADQVRGIGLGGDDYVSKNAGEAVLLARINRVLARAARLREELDCAVEREIRLGDVSVDVRTFFVRENGREISCLTKTECDLLAFFDAHRGELFSADTLISALRGSGFACEDAMLYSHVYRLRQKLGTASALIVHKRGAGYGLVH